MPDYQEYAEFLEGELDFSIKAFIAFTILFIAFVTLIMSGWMRHTEKEESMKSKLLFVAIVFCFFSIIWALLGYQIYGIKYDVNNQAYIVYEGEFSYQVTNAKVDGKTVFIEIDGEELALSPSDIDLDYGVYEGKLVYSEKSKYVLYWEIIRD